MDYNPSNGDTISGPCKLVNTVGSGDTDPVTDEYKANARFTGTIEKVVVDLSGERLIDAETETKMIMKKQ